MDYSRSLSKKAAYRLEARIYVLEIFIGELSCKRKFTAGHMFSCLKQRPSWWFSGFPQGNCSCESTTARYHSVLIVLLIQLSTVDHDCSRASQLFIETDEIRTCSNDVDHFRAKQRRYLIAHVYNAVANVDAQPEEPQRNQATVFCKNQKFTRSSMAVLRKQNPHPRAP